MPYNKRAHLPNNTNDDEEINIAFLSRELGRVTNKYESENKMATYLSRDQQIGLKSLKERDDVVVFQTDKSSEFIIDTKAYENM